jgi:hypothetical protein
LVAGGTVTLGGNCRRKEKESYQLAIMAIARVPPYQSANNVTKQVSNFVLEPLELQKNERSWMQCGYLIPDLVKPATTPQPHDSCQNSSWPHESSFCQDNFLFFIKK